MKRINFAYTNTIPLALAEGVVANVLDNGIVTQYLAVNGAVCPVGKTGETGIKGVVGNASTVTGSIGLTGATNTTSGDKGETGDTGVAGTNGSNGVDPIVTTRLFATADTTWTINHTMAGYPAIIVTDASDVELKDIVVTYVSNAQITVVHPTAITGKVRFR